MLTRSTKSLLKSLIIWLSIVIRENYSTDATDGLTKTDIREILYYHNIFRYLVTVGNVKSQPTAADMQLMKWNQSLVKSLDSIPNECILNLYRNSCPQMNVYRINRNSLFDISKIVRAWFNVNRYYDASTDTCAMTKCERYKRIVSSNNNYIACITKDISNRKFLVCQYADTLRSQPYKVGAPCSQCADPYNVCFKGAFCTTKDECRNGLCDHLMSKSSDDEPQADQQQYCLTPNIDCKIEFFQYMCPKMCSPTSLKPTTQTTTTTKSKLSDDNEVCSMASIDCTIVFFKILCPKSCEGVLCRDPNIDCKNIYYAKCQKCILMNETMSDSRITTTTMPSAFEHAIGLIDPKCQDVSYENYCIERGEMCFHPAYETWMKKFCCSTCTILNLCFDYLEYRSPGKCAEILSSGMCSTLWSQTYCRKSCKQC